MLFSESNISIDEESDQQLPRDKLFLLTSCQPVVDYLNSCDYILYQCIVDFLVPEVLRPIPGTLTQAIRNFAKSLETWLSSSLHGYSSNLVKAKVLLLSYLNAHACKLHYTCILSACS